MINKGENYRKTQDECSNISASNSNCINCRSNSRSIDRQKHEYGEPITNFALKKSTDKLSYGGREHIINAIKGNTIGVDENINI